MQRIHKQYKPDIIHLHSSKAGLLGRIAFPSNKVVYTVHGFDSIRLAYRKFLPLEKIMQHCCKAIIGVSVYDKENLLKENITRNVGYVYNGIYKPSLNISTPLPETTSFSKTILCIARLSKQKNHQLFIDIAKQNPQYAFVWIGNLESVDNLPNNCFFLGNIPNAAAYYNRVDLCILTSNYEGLPMTIIETMSLGKSIVSSQ